MIGSFKTLRWRGAVALTAAYALCLQVLFAYAVAAQAAASHASHEQTSFILCVGNGSDDALGTNAPRHSDAHCPVCTLTSSSAAIPAPVLDVAFGADGRDVPLPFQAQTGIGHKPAQARSRGPPIPV